MTVQQELALFDKNIYNQLPKIGKWISMHEKMPPIFEEEHKCFLGLYYHGYKTWDIDVFTFDGESFWNQNSYNMSNPPQYWALIEE